MRWCILKKNKQKICLVHHDDLVHFVVLLQFNVLFRLLNCLQTTKKENYWYMNECHIWQRYNKLIFILLFFRLNYFKYLLQPLGWTQMTTTSLTHVWWLSLSNHKRKVVSKLTYFSCCFDQIIRSDKFFANDISLQRGNSLGPFSSL